MRKLAAAAFSVSAAIYVSHYLLSPDIWPLAAAICAALSLTAFLFRGELRLRVLIILLALSAGFAAGCVSYKVKTLPAREFAGLETRICATVTDYPTISERYSSVPIRLADETMPRLNGVVYSYGDELDALRPGDEISAKLRIRAADLRYGEEYDRYKAENIYLLCYMADGEIEVTGKESLAFLNFPKILAKAVKESAQNVFSPKSAPLMTALLTGDKELLYNDTQLYANMSEAGILHIVAVSGMHVAFLVGFIRLMVRRKKWASAIAIPIVWLFVPIAGATPSVIRAAFMQSMALTAPLLKRENDGVTSLSAVLAVLLLINPDACASVSLQLSFAAMLGIIVVTPKIYKALLLRLRPKSKGVKKKAVPLKKIKEKVLLSVYASFASTVGALTFSTPIAALHFGCVSLIGLLVNILVFSLVSASFILGYIACFLGILWLPLGTVPGAFTSVLANIVIALIRRAASVPYAAVYTEGSVFGYWLLLVYAVLIICYVFRRKEGFRPIIPVCLAICSLCAVIVINDLRKDCSADAITVVDVGQGQSLIMTSGRATAVIDCGGKGKLKNAGETVAAKLLREGRQSVDVLALTHFDEDHVNGVIRLMSRIEVRRLVMPPDSFDKPACREIRDFAENCGTQVYIISEDTELYIGGISITAFPNDNQKEPALMFWGSMGDFDLLITGDAKLSDERRFLKNHKLSDVELLIAGHHGSKHASSVQLLSELGAEYAVVSVGYNTYGHPTQEALTRFADAGMTVMRTDQLGDIRFRLE